MTEQTQPTDAELIAELEAAGVQFMAFRGGISGTKDVWTTSGSQKATQIAAGMRAAIAKWGTPAGAAPVTKERFSEPLARVINAGYLLANCAFNLAQRPGTEISIGTAKTLSDCRKEWDAACAAHKALPPAPQPTQAHIEKCAVCGDGNARLLVMRNCDVCGSDYAGQSESEVSVALERARRATQAQAGAVPLTDIRKTALDLYTPPFRHEHGYIRDANNQMVADDAGSEGSGLIASRIRGWGRIQYMDKPEQRAAALQDEVSEVVAAALNAYWATHGITAHGVADMKGEQDVDA